MQSGRIQEVFCAAETILGLLKFLLIDGYNFSVQV